ncbi:zinc finger CCCH domain-containing protein 18-like, partial [Trifolium medium]|nr:zinc finger CCCH domain-containing protein 18-like [Trifolium medium]
MANVRVCGGWKEDNFERVKSGIRFAQVHEELVQAIKDAEEGLLHLKRSRLLSEADTLLPSTNIFAEEEKLEPIDPADVEPEPLEEKCYPVGSTCRFRYKDGR